MTVELSKGSVPALMSHNEEDLKKSGSGKRRRKPPDTFCQLTMGQCYYL
jgi:hypothetical protein